MRNSANIIIVQGQEYAETEMSVRSVVTIDKDMILKDNDFSFEIKIKYMGWQQRNVGEKEKNPSPHWNRAFNYKVVRPGVRKLFDSP